MTAADEPTALPNPARAGFVAALYPAALLVASAFVLRADADDGLTELTLDILGVVLVVVAAPTSWVFALPFVNGSALTMNLFGAVTSLPLWFLLGREMARRTPTWHWWWMRYLTFAFAWTGLVLMAVVAVTRL